MKKILCLVLCLALLAGVLPLAAHAVTTIDKVSLTLAYPEAGKEPPQTATWNGTGYSVHAIDWLDSGANRYLEPGEKIQAGHSYAVTIWVEADSGYEFNAANDNTPSISASVNGEWVEVTKAYEYKAWAMVTLTYYFSRIPEKEWIKSVDLSIPAPVAGEKPTYYQISTNTYRLGNVYFSGETNPKMKNGIAWYPTATGDWMTPETAVFDANTAYTMHCLIFPAEGYRFTNDAVVRVNGKTAKTSLDYDTFLAVTYNFPATGSAHTHTPSEWRTTGIYHYTVCTTCGDMLEQEDHYGGVSSCAEPMVCSACGYAYKEPHENHTPDTSKWIARIDMYHFHACKYCGAHCDIEDHKWSPTYLYQDSAGHAWICADCKGKSEVMPHTPGPEATETAPQTCKDCGYIIAPAKNHTHELTEVKAQEPTCTEAGVKAHYTCAGCSDLFADKDGKNKMDDISLPALGHDINDGKCTRCDYAEPGAQVPDSTQEPTAEATEPATDPTVAPTEKPDVPQKPKLPSYLPLLIVLCCVGAAAVAVIIIVVIKRKKG